MPVANAEMNRRTFIGAFGAVVLGALARRHSNLLEVAYTNLIAEPPGLENVLDSEIETGSFLEHASDTLDISTYNIHRALDSSLADDIKGLGDIVLLQEVPMCSDNLPRQLAKDNMMDYASGLMNCYKDMSDKIVLTTLSKYPIISADVIRLPLGFDWQKEWDRKGGPIALRTEHETPFGSLTVYCTHLDNRTTPEYRSLQMQKIVSDVPSGQPVVVGGDMNLNLNSFWYREPVLDVLEQSGFKEPVIDGYSMRLQFSHVLRLLGLEMRLDRVFARGIEPIEGKVLYDRQASDHFPVRVTYEI